MRLPTRSRTELVALEALEGRKLLSTLAGTVHAANLLGGRSEHSLPFARLERDHKKLVIDIQQMQLGSNVTEAEVQALDKDLGAWNVPGVVPNSRVNPSSESPAVYAIVLDVEYGYTESGFTPEQWANNEAAIIEDLNQIRVAVPTSEVDQVIADLKTIANSAGVTVEENMQYFDHVATYLSDENPASHPPASIDPFNYFNKQLPGFVHGG